MSEVPPHSDLNGVWFQENLLETNDKLTFHKPLINYITDDFGTVAVRVESAGVSALICSDTVNETRSILRAVALALKLGPIVVSGVRLRSATDFKLKLFGTRLYVTFRAEFERI